MNFFVLFSSLFLAILSNVESGRLSFGNGNYVVQWTYLPATKEIEFDITAKAYGWVGLGISKENVGMRKLDLAIGGTKNGEGYLKVTKAKIIMEITNTYTHRADISYDYKIKSLYTRKRSTYMQGTIE